MKKILESIDWNNVIHTLWHAVLLIGQGYVVTHTAYAWLAMPIQALAQQTPPLGFKEGAVPFIKVAAMVLLVVSLASCAHSLGYAGSHPGYVKCKGKGSITGTGFGQVSAGIGGGEQNSFTIQADCGDGFEFSQGQAISSP